jgi:hypothetical protein
MGNENVEFPERFLRIPVAVEVEPLNQAHVVDALGIEQLRSLGLFSEEFGGVGLSLNGRQGHVV